MNFFLDLAAFNIFILVVGLYPLTASGASPQEAANITFAINGLAFIPALGLAQAIGILVGQAMGAGDADLARRLTRRGLVLAMLYMGTMAVIYVTVPEWLLQWFARSDDPQQVATLQLAAHFLLFCCGLGTHRCGVAHFGQRAQWRW